MGPMRELDEQRHHCLLSIRSDPAPAAQAACYRAGYQVGDYGQAAAAKAGSAKQARSQQAHRRVATHRRGAGRREAGRMAAVSRLCANRRGGGCTRALPAGALAQRLFFQSTPEVPPRARPLFSHSLQSSAGLIDSKRGKFRQCPRGVVSISARRLHWLSSSTFKGGRRTAAGENEPPPGAKARG